MTWARSLAVLGLATGCAGPSALPPPPPLPPPVLPAPLRIAVGDPELPAPGEVEKPVDPDHAASLGVAADRVCVLHADGSAWCVRPGSRAPEPLGFDHIARLVPAEADMCAILMDHTARCDSFTLPELGEVADLAFGRDLHCALMRGGPLRCWRPNDGSRALAVEIPGRVTQVDAKFEHVCAVTEAGEVFCWGDNGSGELGVRKPEHSDRPLRVPGVTNAVEVSTGGDHTCAREADGRVRCWGAGYYLQEGSVTADNFVPPTRVPGVVARAISAGAHHTCALTASETVCWGWNLWSQMGSPGSDRREPLPVVELQAARGLGAHGAVTCALLSGERVACLGGYTPAFFGPWRAGAFTPR